MTADSFARRHGASTGRLLAVAVVASLVVVPFTVAPVAAVDTYASITDVTASPEQPAPGELTRIETTIRNAGNRSQAVEITDLVVRHRDSAEEVTRIENLGTVAPGGTMRVPTTVSFAETGVKQLRVVVVGEDEAGDAVRLEYPLTLVVSEGGPQLRIDVEDPTTGGETPVTVNVTNGDETAVRNLDLVVDGSNVRVDDPERIAAVLDAGAERSFSYTATFARAPRSTLEATLRYTTAEGQSRSVRTTRTVPLGPAETADRPQVELSVRDAVPGATRPVNVTVANGLDGDVRQVRVLAASESATFLVDERVRARLQAGQDARFRFPARVDEAGTHPVNVTLVYTEDGLRHRVTRTFQANFGAPSNPGEVRLTGVQAVDRGGTLEVSATAGNVGSDAVEGVVVSVADAPNVGQADYFVGNIDGSDFASFTLTTSVSGNVSSVPVEVRYVVGGVERSTTTEVPVEQAAVQRPEPSGGGFPVALVGGAAVLLVVLGAVYRRWG